MTNKNHTCEWAFGYGSFAAFFSVGLMGSILLIFPSFLILLPTSTLIVSVLYLLRSNSIERKGQSK